MSPSVKLVADTVADGWFLLADDGAWRWNKVYRIGETCGLKLCYNTTREEEPCKLCEALFIKHHKIDKMEADIQRWLSEATVEKGREVLSVMPGCLLLSGN